MGPTDCPESLVTNTQHCLTPEESEGLVRHTFYLVCDISLQFFYCLRLLFIFCVQVLKFYIYALHIVSKETVLQTVLVANIKNYFTAMQNM